MTETYKFIAYNDNMTLNNECWFVFEISPRNKKDVVFYYNPKEDTDYENLKLKDFFNDYADNHFCSRDEVIIGQNDEKTDNIYWKASVKEGPETSDSDGETSWTEMNFETTYSQAMKNIKVSDIPQIFKDIYSAIENLENDEADNIADSNDEASDPYGYRGLRRSDFF